MTYSLNYIKCPVEIKAFKIHGTEHRFQFRVDLDLEFFFPLPYKCLIRKEFIMLSAFLLFVQFMSGLSDCISRKCFYSKCVRSSPQCSHQGVTAPLAPLWPLFP